MGMIFPDKYCLRDKKTGYSESFDDLDKAALFLKMHGSNTVDAGGTETLKKLGEHGYDTEGNKHGLLGFLGL